MQARLITLACLMVVAPWAHAQTATSARSQYDIDSKLALTRYQEDQKVCKEVPDAPARMQCYRDAKTEHDRAITAAKAKRDASSKAAATNTASPPTAQLVRRPVLKKNTGIITSNTWWRSMSMRSWLNQCASMMAPAKNAPTM